MEKQHEEILKDTCAEKEHKEKNIEGGMKYVHTNIVKATCIYLYSCNSYSM